MNSNITRIDEIHTGIIFHYQKKEYTVESINSSDMVIIPNDSSVRITVSIFSNRFMKMFPNIDIEIPDEEQRLAVKVERTGDLPTFFIDETEPTEAEWEQEETSLIDTSLQEIFSKRGSTVKKATLENLYRDLTSEDREELRFIFTCYLNRKLSFHFEPSKLVPLLRNVHKNVPTHKTNEKYSTALWDYMDTWWETDREAIRQDYIDLASLIPLSARYNYIYTICGFEWDSMFMSHKDIQDVFKKIEYEDELEEYDELDEDDLL
ncbi:hypothetical protein ThvES_00013390 [Thiovulum sp. ES]|nr:hypothetical protein ThvES_00013390 [Thiovulum sp. ES]